MKETANPNRSYRLNAHRRLLIAAAVVGGFMLLLPRGMPMSLRIATSWDAGIVFFLGLTWWVIHQCPRQYTRQTVLANDQGRAGVLLLVLVAIAASVAAIFFLLEKPKGGGAPPTLQGAAPVATIVCSWVLTHVMFALHYAHRFYRDDPTTPEQDATGGLKFPGDQAPDYWDFLYFSFVIGMTWGVSGGQALSPGRGGWVIGPGPLSFPFYTIALALGINIVA